MDLLSAIVDEVFKVGMGWAFEKHPVVSVTILSALLAAGMYWLMA
jgi:hypothetical protein